MVTPKAGRLTPRLEAGAQAGGELSRGALTVYLAATPGAWATTRMLTDSLDLAASGERAVVACLESDRDEAVRALAARVGGVPAEVLDVDGIAAGAGTSVLVDGLAHGNPAWARNRHRHQDVSELLDRGVDVATTLSLDQIESYADVVERVTGRRSVERVPDAFMEGADRIILVDSEPDRPAPDAEAALQELARRYVALVTGRRTAHGQLGSTERLLVAIGPSPSSAHLVRWTRQRAFGLGAPWTALHVDTGRPLGDSGRDELRRNLELARQLGAEVVTIASGEGVADAVLAYARAHQVTEIVAGGTGELKRRLRGRTVAARLLAGAGDIAISVVREEGRDMLAPPERPDDGPRPSWRSLLVALIAIAAASGLGMLLAPVAGPRAVSILFLLAIVGLSLVVNRVAVLVAALASFVALPYLFLPPRFDFRIGSAEDVLVYLLYVATAVAIASIMSRIRRNEVLLAARERRLELAFGFSQAVSVKQTVDDIVRAGIDYAARSFGAEVAVYLHDGRGGIEQTRAGLPAAAETPIERDAASWCFRHRAPCGVHTDTYHGARYHYVPLRSPDSVVGVLGVRPPEGRPWMPEQEHTLEMLTVTLALSLERELLAEANKRNLMARESERLGKLLLSTVSHQLRTPLTTIKGSITAMMEDGTDSAVRSVLLGETLEAAERLNATVENILSMNRLESGLLRLRRAETDLADLASAVADARGRQPSGHRLAIRLPDQAPPVSVDIVLMSQVVHNLVGNAVRHTPEGTAVELAFVIDGGDLHITVSDDGPGVPAEELGSLFDTFFRGRHASSGGVGLGLSICKGIVAAHGGTVRAWLNDSGGLSVEAVLPGCVGEQGEET